MVFNAALFCRLHVCASLIAREGFPLRYAFALRGLAAAVILFAATVACGQRVQFPSAVPEGSPYTAPPPVTPPPSYAPPPPARAARPRPLGIRTPSYAAPGGRSDPAVGRRAPGQPTTFIGNATRFFQQIDFDNTYIAGNNTGNNLGITDTEISATFAIPDL